MKKLSILVIGVCLCGLYGCSGDSGDQKSKFVDVCIADGPPNKNFSEAQTKKLCTCMGNWIFSSTEFSDKTKKNLSRGKDPDTEKEGELIFKKYMECASEAVN